ncbi:methionyl-tRNA formyltransferase [Sphingomonas sp. IC-11]|uniref:formyltransferase family protein n=1 Tax=Sphingomonas sp. IC-11 TaxID=2898528 RepID=UPI001E4D8294|nr:formyltransferase family protein [Sphingomonas sp. IC-11]MCD2317021.1 methionyl-tRNA formyltransferase [Sphingomonas sp. IC-11]
MRALLIGAVEGTRVALDAIANAPGWTLAAVASLPIERASRHSDFVDLAPGADAASAQLIRVTDGNSADFIEQVRAIAPDFTFVIGWSQLCGPALRQAVNDRVVGYHTAALPRLRGRATIPWTILLDEKITGSTLFRIDDGVDSGPILSQRFFHVAPDETAASLYSKHMAALGSMMIELLPALAVGAAVETPQDDRLATWAARRRPSDGWIDWTRAAADVDRLVRAVGRPYPGATTVSSTGPMTIWRTERFAGTDRYHALPGQVLDRDESTFVVRCGDGEALRVLEFSGAAIPPLHTHLRAAS